MLHLCQACGQYKQSGEYYYCCLQDTMRCCRECMLGRPNEPFGEHFIEEQRTRTALKLADLYPRLLQFSLRALQRLLRRQPSLLRTASEARLTSRTLL